MPTVLLLAAALCPAGVPAAAAAHYDRGADPHRFTVFMQDGGWCWYQDPRAILHDGHVYIGSVKGSENGEALVGAYDLEAGKRLPNFVVAEQFDRDDHNSPVFFARPDGSLLTTYARHGREPYHYSRTCPAGKPQAWGEESKHFRQGRSKKDNATYMNLYELSDEGKLYNFYRGIEFNPTFVSSGDGGRTWSDPVHLFANEVDGRQRPYARYAGNGRDTVHVSVTDAHPRNYGNSIYYFQFRGGKFFKADGSPIKDLGSGGPLLPSEAELVYRGSMTGEKPAGCESVPGAAWTSAIEIDRDGRPHIGYSLYLSNDDHRYRLASWDGRQWIDREIAHAGTCLYPAESSYTGLVTLDPVDPTVVFISTDVDPASGEGGGRHEIYRAKIGPGDDIRSIRWQAVTANSPVSNLRPMVLRQGDRRVVLWQRGVFHSYRNYDLDTVGFTEAVR